MSSVGSDYVSVLRPLLPLLIRLSLYFFNPSPCLCFSSISSPSQTITSFIGGKLTAGLWRFSWIRVCLRVYVLVYHIVLLHSNTTSRQRHKANNSAHSLPPCKTHSTHGSWWKLVWSFTALEPIRVNWRQLIQTQFKLWLSESSAAKLLLPSP